MVRPYGLDNEDQPFEQTWGIPQAPPKPISSFKPVPQPESVGLAPKIDTGASSPKLSEFGSPAPPKSILGTDVAPGETISDKQMPKAEHLAENPKDAENFQAHQERSNTLRDFGQKDADIRGQIISLDPHTPDYLKKLGELHAAQGAIQEEKAHFERGTPWGTAGNHPGVFGKIGHVLGEIGNVAGQALAPGLTEAIPGSQLNLQEQEQGGRAQEKFGSDLANSEAKAEAAGTTAGAHVTTAEAAKQNAETKAASQPIRDEALDRQTTVKENALPAQAGADIAAGGDVNDPKMQKIVPAAKALQAASGAAGKMQHVTDAHGNPANYHPDSGTYTHPDGTPFPDFKPMTPPAPVGGLLVDPNNRVFQAKPGETLKPGTQNLGGFAGMNRPTTQMRNVDAQAQVASQGIPDVVNEIQRLGPQLGPVAGRWNEFIQGKVGADNPEFAGLRADLLMVSSAVALAHARGRLPENLREEFDHMINAPQQTPENIVSTLTHVKVWMDRMGQMGQIPGTGGATPPTAATPPNASDPLGILAK